MGATGAFRSLQSTELLSQVLANEFICATEALDRIPHKPGGGVADIHNWVRKYVGQYDGDTVMSKECTTLNNRLLDGSLQQIFG